MPLREAGTFINIGASVSAEAHKDEFTIFPNTDEWTLTLPWEQLDALLHIAQELARFRAKNSNAKVR